MIVDLLVSVLFGILNAVLGVIPVFEVWNPELGLSGTSGNISVLNEHVADSLYAMNLFIPVPTLIYGLLAILATRVFVWGVQFVRWLWSVIPFKSA
jgi:hypothetical protein